MAVLDCVSSGCRVFLINTMNNDRVISRHRTIEAAEAADRRLQRQTRRYNGSNCWSPTRIEVRYRYRTSERFNPLDTIDARNFEDARQQLILLVDRNNLDWAWVEDLDGVRFEIGNVPAGK